MVSKVAVVALVVIVACPILLGYGMNLEQHTVSEYKESKDALDVTPLLKVGEQYTIARADYYRLNTNFVSDLYYEYPVMPIYQKTTSENTSLPYNSSSLNWTGGSWNLTTLNSTYLAFEYTLSPGYYVNVDVYSGGTLTNSITRITYLLYESSTDTITYYNYYDSYSVLPEVHQISGGNYTSVTTTLVGFSSVKMYFGTQPKTSPYSNFIDFSAGFRIDENMAYSYIKLPEQTKSYLMTINLNSVTESNCPYIIQDNYNFFKLIKTTTNGVVTWACSGNNGNQQIYYDSSRSDNTYQYYTEFVEDYISGGTHYYKTHSELRYVGGWPTLIGEAPSYLIYEFDNTTSVPVGFEPSSTGFDSIRIYRNDGGHSPTPIIRMDAATFSAFQYMVIKDKVYDPAGFRTNPITRITDIGKYGTYIAFGGVIFNVTDGNITLGTHELSIRNVVFKSIPTPNGYENKINDTVISTTINPSTLTFGGEWGAKVVTSSMASSTVTKTDWTPGQFAWDGIDQNFLMIGLLTAIGVFIALGIAYRKTKAALGALLVVCGGAILLFFTML